MLYIHGIGLFHPSNVIDNDFLTQLDIGTDDEWITSRTGIKTRYTNLSLDYIRRTLNADPCNAVGDIEYTSAQTSAMAAKKALLQARISKDQIGSIVAGTSSPEFNIPTMACTVAKELELKVPSFDLNSACSTFVTQLHAINNMMPEATADYILLIVTDHVTRHTNYNDRRSCLLFGDCATAVIVSKKIPSSVSVPYTFIGSDPAHLEYLQCRNGGHGVMDQGGAVQKFAIKQTLAVLQQLEQHTDYQVDRDYFVGHQANLRVLEYICKANKIASDKHFYNVDRFGNCGAASAPSVLAMHWDKPNTGDRIGLAVMGAGLSWGGAVLEYI